MEVEVEVGVVEVVVPSATSAEACAALCTRPSLAVQEAQAAKLSVNLLSSCVM